MGAKLWEMHNRWDVLSSKEKIFSLSAEIKTLHVSHRCDEMILTFTKPINPTISELCVLYIGFKKLQATGNVLYMFYTKGAVRVLQASCKACTLQHQHAPDRKHPR